MRQGMHQWIRNETIDTEAGLTIENESSTRTIRMSSVGRGSDPPHQPMERNHPTIL